MLRYVIAPVALLAFVIPALPAQADADLTLLFDRITSNSPVDVAAQFRVEVMDLGAGGVQFEFFNDGPLSSAIADVYWENTTPPVLDFSSPTLPSNWDDPASPGHLPGGTLVVAYSADSNAPVAQNGINPNESAIFTFDLASGRTFNDLVGAFENGDIVIGMHVQRLPDNIDGTGDDESDSFITGPPVLVPTPPGLLLGAIGLFGLTFIRRRNSQSNK